GAAAARRRVEAKETKDAQIVLGDALCRITYETHLAQAQIVETAGIIVNRPVACRRKRVDGEIASFGVRSPVAAELDLGVAAVGFDIFAQCGYFERLFVDDNGDCAVLDAGRHQLEAGRNYAFHDVLGDSGGAHIDFPD